MARRQTGKQTDGGNLMGRQRGGDGDRGWQIERQTGKQTDGDKLRGKQGGDGERGWQAARRRQIDKQTERRGR